MRGVLNNTCFFDADDIYLYYRIDDSDYVCSTRSTQSDNENLVCTTAEFNALVEKMSLGLDINPVNHGHYMYYICADKVLLKKEVKPLVYAQGVVDDGCQVEFGTWSYTEAGQCLVADKSLLKKDSAVNKPLIYTQEMADNGELPSVGMECMIYNAELMNPEYEKAIIHFAGCHVIVYSSESCTERACSLELVKFKYIDQRTKKEKAIDELIDFDNSICNDTEWYANFLQAIIDGKITGVKWVGE